MIAYGESAAIGETWRNHTTTIPFQRESALAFTEWVVLEERWNYEREAGEFPSSNRGTNSPICVSKCTVTIQSIATSLRQSVNM